MKNKLNVLVSEKEFETLPGNEQNKIIYRCLLDLQDRVNWRWKQVLMMGAAAGAVAGFFKDLLRG